MSNMRKCSVKAPFSSCNRHVPIWIKSEKLSFRYSSCLYLEWCHIISLTATRWRHSQALTDVTLRHSQALNDKTQCDPQALKYVTLRYSQSLKDVTLYLSQALNESRYVTHRHWMMTGEASFSVAVFSVSSRWITSEMLPGRSPDQSV